jgi:dTDP-4-dehydrorhamnose reductase
MNESILVFGGRGLVGSRFIELFQQSFEIHAPLSSEINVLNSTLLESCLSNSLAGSVVNFSAFTDVDRAEFEKGDKRGLVYKLNTQAPKELARLCCKYHKHLVQISTAYVFNGQKEDTPYHEEDKPDPLNWYGLTKHLGEEGVLESTEDATIVRIDMPYSIKHKGKQDFARYFLEKLLNREEVEATADQRVTPVFVDEVVESLKVILDKKMFGVFHISPLGYITPFEFAQKLARMFGLDESLIKPRSSTEFNQRRSAHRPQHTWMDNRKFVHEVSENILHDIDEEIELFKVLIRSQGLLK